MTTVLHLNFIIFILTFALEQKKKLKHLTMLTKTTTDSFLKMNTGYYYSQLSDSLLTFRTAVEVFKIPLTDEKKNKLFAKIDTDEDDLINYNEFMISVQDINNRKMIDAFCSVDTDDDKLISIDEFRLFSSV